MCYFKSPFVHLVLISFMFLTVLAGFTPSNHAHASGSEESKLVGTSFSGSSLRIERYCTYYRGQKFTTGTAELQYKFKVTKLKLSFKNLSSYEGNSIRVSLNKESSDGWSGNEVFKFGKPSNFQAGSSFEEFEFTAPSNSKSVLKPQTKYYIVVTTSYDDFSLQATEADDNAEDSDSADGWTVEDSSISWRQVSGTFGCGYGNADTSQKSFSMVLYGYSVPKDGAVRFAELPSTVEDQEEGSISGRLEIYNDENDDGDGSWGWICDDGFGDTEAEVACSGLGYDEGEVWDLPEGWSSIDKDTATMEQLAQAAYLSSSPCILDDVDCGDESNESTLFDCEHSGREEHDCILSESVGVTCSDQN